MKKNLLSLLVIAGFLLINCGNEPPEEFYNGTPEDSTQIHGLIDDEPELLVSEDMFDETYTVTDPGAVQFLVADSFFRDDPYMVKVHVDSTGVDLMSRLYALDFWFAKDTTCTVYMYDTFSVNALMHYDVKYTAYYDSIHEIDPETHDTTWRIGTTVIDSTPGERELLYPGVGCRHIYFDPKRDTVMEVDEDGDTTYTYPVKEPHEFVLKRISYGTYHYPAAGTDLPAIDMVMLTRATGQPDSIIASSYDTLYRGHVMNRFRSIDSLLQIDLADLEQDTLGNYWLDIDITLGFGTVTSDLCNFFASCNGTNRVELPDGSGKVQVTGTGLTYFAFEAVVSEVYFYLLPEKEYRAQVWLIPVMINGGA